ncbi:RICIN domain-containing protein [Streptomyces sp. NBC_00083]|uniref:RICIN domain-containing protein n=1 Tax=Streptomyces sp. NBC_00083 TaxID=2975647 RepID=UPI00224DB065|nr:RICIN domain-containing protein [Streptomyces sp. NBC_00083]MCX5384537.1 RICIN domain-containing protein [Streptomyces sp. NBC_00083]
MKRKMTAMLAVAGIAAATQLALGSTPASASGAAYQLKNVATGKCMRGANSNNTYAVTMVKCNRNDAGQWWGVVQGQVHEVFAGTHDTNVCLAVPKGESGDAPKDVDTTSCNNYKTYYLGMSTIPKANRPTTLGTVPGYIGHYASGDTYLSCYQIDGNYTKWLWVP